MTIINDRIQFVADDFAGLSAAPSMIISVLYVGRHNP
jgi:hypothetical protein